MEFQGKDSERGFRERDAEQNRLDALRDDYYKLYFAPTEMFLGGAPATLAEVNSNPVAQFAAAGTDYVSFTFVKPELWRNGEASVTVYWSTDGTDVNDQDIKVQLVSLGEEDAALSNVNIISETLSLTPVSTAEILYGDTWSTVSNPILDTHKALGLTVQRLGSTDSNTDDTYYIGAVVEFLPKVRQ